MRKWPVVFGICGASNSGKTQLVTEILPRLRARGLRTGVVKRCGSHLEADTRGKDSDRIFRAGGDIVAQGPHESFTRRHGREENLDEVVGRLGRVYDLVLVECRSDEPIPKVWLCREGEEAVGGECGDAVCVLRWGVERCAEAEAHILQAVEQAHAATPVCAAVLIGGESSRMGQPKSMLRSKGGFVLERIVAQARCVVQEALLVGAGEVPESLSNMPRLPDVPGLAGPVAGLLSAFRWQPEARWLVLACDLPLLSSQAVEWLVEQSTPGIDAVLPHLDDPELSEPLFALYEPGAGVFLERAVGSGVLSIRKALAGSRIVSPRIPAHLRSAWVNANTPTQWQCLNGEAGD